MEVVTIVAAGVIFLIGVFLGMRIGKHRFDSNYVMGALNVEITDDNCDLYLASNEPVTRFVTKDYVIFKVNTITQNSHK